MNPFSPSLWRSAWYLFAYLLLGAVLWAVVMTALTAATILAVTLAGIPLLVAVAGVIRGCANVERVRAAEFIGEPISADYHKVTRSGLLAHVSTRWKDPATWRNIAYLAGLFPLLFALDGTVIVIWLVLLAGITMPIWYWAPPQTFDNGTVGHGLSFGNFPNGPYGHGAEGIFINTLPEALVAALACLILFVLFSPVVKLTARTHARIARALLRAPSDPLTEARDVLAGPGPLPSLKRSHG
jgi:Putative sensor